MAVYEKEATIEIPNVFLTGIPTCLLTDGGPERRVDRIDADLKLFMGNRHEHFRPLAETVTIDGRELRIFQWTHSTFVAE
jgi:hypothetical protein